MPRVSANAAGQPERHADRRQQQPVPHEHAASAPCRCAPSAMRIPISRVRCETEYEITP